MSGIFAELRRRNVFRVAAAYAVIAWILVEVLSTVLPMFGSPEWVLRVLVVLLVAGFVPAVIFAWAFEITPGGIKRASEVDRGESITGRTAKKLDIIVIALLVVAIGFVAVDRLVLDPRRTGAPEVVSTGRIDSIAVLPFVDFSPGGDHAYLGTGIADTILHSLTQIEGLKVAARTSSFQLHEQNADIPTIGRTLGVGAVLEGSVQAAGNRLRIIAQLVRSSDQSHLWSKTFDSTTDDIFATQDTIAEAVVETLRGGDAPGPAAQARTSPEVFELVAKGRHLWQQRNPADTAAAVAALKRAVELDPEYAPGWAELTAAHWFEHLYGNADRSAAREAALAAADKALALDDSLSQPWGVRGLIADTPAEAIAAYERALELNPNNANAMAWLSLSLREAGLHNEGRRMIERAYHLDPMATYVRGAYARALSSDDDPANRRRALEIVEESLRLTPGAFRAIADAAEVTARVGDLVTAIGYMVEGLRMRPDSATLRRGMLTSVLVAGERDAVLRWGASIDALQPDAPFGSWAFAVNDWDGWLAWNEANLAQQPDNPFRIADYASALALAGRYAESIEWYERALQPLSDARYRDIPSTAELSARHQLIWLYENAGKADRAAALRDEIGPMLETLKRNGLGGDFFTAMLVTHQMIVLGDMDGAANALKELDGTNEKYFAFIWQNMLFWDKFSEREDVKKILAAWREDQRRLRERLRAEAPPVVFDPDLLEAET